MNKISKRAQFVVVNDGRIVSGHVRGDVARAAANKIAGYAASTPVTPRGADQIVLTVGQRVRVENGMALPV